jgi:hypothetical protein
MDTFAMLKITPIMNRIAKMYRMQLIKAAG